MKNVLGFILAIVFLPAAQVQAWVGGPFSGNTYTSNGDDGVYEAIATVEDGLGMYRWVVNNQGLAGTGGNALSFGGGGFGTSNVTFGGLAVAQSSHIWWYRGVTYYGQCFGTANSALNRVTCIGNANDAGTDGQGSTVNQVSLAGGATGTPTNIVPAGAFGAGIAILRQGPANRKSFCTSNFIAKFDARKTEYTYVKRFRGKGRLTFFGLPDQAVLLLDTAGFNTTQDFSLVDVSIGNNDDTFSRNGHTRVINVFGSRVSNAATGFVSSGN